MPNFFNISLRPNTATVMSVGALAIISGVILKNGYSEQLGNKAMAMPGMALFMGGWLLVALAMGYVVDEMRPQFNMRTYASMAAAGAVLVAVMSFKKKLPIKLSMNISGLLFIGGWLALAYIGSSSSYTDLSPANFDSRRAMYAIPGALLVLAAMAFGVLKFERANNITDGFGMPMFVLGWVLTIVANSLH